MAPILSIPYDIFIIFGEYVDDEDDFLALRMTCKEFNEKFREFHLKSIYASRRLFYAPQSFENLLKISKHPSGINKLVRDLTICWATPYYKLNSGRDHLVLEIIGSAHTHNEEFDDIRDLIFDIAKLAVKGMKDIQKFQKSGKEAEILSSALKNLPNLRSIQIHRDRRQWESFSRSEINLFFPGLEMTPGKRLPKIPKAIGYGGHTYVLRGMELVAGPLHMERPAKSFWQLPLSSILLSEITYLEMVSCSPMDSNCHAASGSGVHMEFFDMSPDQLASFKVALGNLKSLKLEIGTLRDAYEGRPERMADLNAKFCDWLEAVGSNLEELSLRRGFCSDSIRHAHTFPTKSGLPKLKRLSLKLVAMYRLNLQQFLDKSKTELRELRIEYCTLEHDDHPTTRWYTVLQYLNENCERLQKLFLDPFFEDDVDLDENSISDDIETPSFKLPLLHAKTTGDSIFRSCFWNISFPPPDSIPYTAFKPIGEILRRPLTAEGFWDLASDRKWRFHEFIESKT
ncbi:hypothetical protein TWF481_002109 [Arthrobotrys musiformis]|uniref:F-box domain-containing protein n=1 Tax=Arthrobotrys musiformis TaxID=47236 RepID=A0AAV9VS84_9PEZI